MIEIQQTLLGDSFLHQKKKKMDTGSVSIFFCLLM